jgi:hypothetical protein
MSLKLIIMTEIFRDLKRGVNEFKKGYQSRIYITKGGNGNLLADPQNILNRWNNFFNQLLLWWMDVN